MIQDGINNRLDMIDIRWPAFNQMLEALMICLEKFM